MKAKVMANLEWVNQEWRRFMDSERGRRICPTGEAKVGPTHLAKLFAAFCVERLQIEAKTAEKICSACGMENVAQHEIFTKRI